MKALEILAVLLLSTSPITAESCTGDLIWQDAASICIATCTAHYYPDKELCPTRTIGRCVCPEGKIKLEDTSDVCVDPLSKECRQATRKYMDNPSSQFQFTRQPEDVTVTVGDTVTMSCLVSNEYSIQYIWYKLDELPQGDGTAEKNLYMTGTSELVFKDISPEEAGFYQCKAVASSNFLMISGVGQIKVNHFTTEATIETDERVTLHNPIFELKCAEINAYPTPEIKWYFGDVLVEFENPSYFMNRNEDSPDYGSLYIQNVQNDHAGIYTCRGASSTLGKTADLAQRNVIITGSQNTVSGAPKVMETANYGDKQKKGEEGVLFCAGYGYPPPAIKWFKVVAIGEEQPEIAGCTESKCVDQGGRRLKIYNLQDSDFGDYQCVATNSFDHVTKIIAMAKEPDSYEVRFESISTPVKVLPNRYTSFTLTCEVNTSQNPETYMGWYQNTQGIANKGERTRTFSSTENGISIQKLVFDYPTNEDHGVYQCLAYNSRTFKQATTDVFVYTSQGSDDEGYNTDSAFAADSYDPNTVKDYKYFSEAKNAAEADRTCQEWRTDAHLATILNYKENDLVFDILMANKDKTNETRAWIGLTDETTEGVWLWLSGEISDRFSFWWKNEPDNSESERDYAFMDAAKSGHWLGGDFNLKLPFVCKHYNASCTDLETQTELDIKFEKYLKKRLSSKVSVYDRASVKCGDQSATLECAPSGKWVLAEGSTCSQIATVKDKEEPVTGAGLGLTHQTVYLFLILSYLLT